MALAPISRRSERNPRYVSTNIRYYLYVNVIYWMLEAHLDRTVQVHRPKALEALVDTGELNLKNRYDPVNAFRLDQNIRPTA